jgi:hypothetical protein
LEKEIWRTIPFCENYQVSNFGRAKSLDRVIKTKTGDRNLPGVLLRGRENPGGYVMVTIFKNTVRMPSLIHRLVLLTFVGLPPEGKEIGMHIDDNKLNNHVSNLKWGSASENNQQTYDHKRRVAPCNSLGKTGSLSPHAKAVIQMDLTGNPIKVFGSAKEAYAETKVCWPNIAKCCKGKRPTAGGFKWKYAA